MPNPNRLYDKSHLSIDQGVSRGFIQGDYIAHCFRWSHVVKLLMQRHQYKDAHRVDVGCGKDQPLPRMLYSSKMTGFDYTGIDMNRMEFHESLVTAHNNDKIRVALLEETDASILSADDLPWGQADFLVCFEVLEHIQPFIVHRMLNAWKKQVKPGGTLFVSTPVFNGSAAANHINEMSRNTLGRAFEMAGFTIKGNYGTFASQSDLKAVMEPYDLQLMDQLGNYYDSNVLATIFAPIYPQASRNNLWVLENKATMDPTFTGSLDTELNQNSDIAELFTGRVEG